MSFTLFDLSLSSVLNSQLPFWQTVRNSCKTTCSCSQVLREDPLRKIPDVCAHFEVPICDFLVVFWESSLFPTSILSHSIEGAIYGIL